MPNASQGEPLCPPTPSGTDETAVATWILEPSGPQDQREQGAWAFPASNPSEPAGGSHTTT